jgi:hypothetical protein
MKKPKVLTRLKISEVSSVDAGAGDGCKVVLYKRDGTPDFHAIFRKHSRRPEPLQYLDRYAGEDAGAGGHFAKRSEGEAPDAGIDADDADDRIAALEDELDARDDETGDSDLGKSHPVAAIADLLAEAHAAKGVTRANVTYWMAHTPAGRSFLRACMKTVNKQKEQSTMSDTRELAAIAKTAGGMEAICERIVTKGETNFSEHELVAAFSEGIVRKPANRPLRARMRIVCP